jgi:hypothetical protein
LPLIFRIEEFLKEVINQFAIVVHVDNSDLYRARMLGPKIRIIPANVNELPKMITLPRIDGVRGINHELIYIGGPEECERCHKTDPSVKNCPVPQINITKGAKQMGPQGTGKMAVKPNYPMHRTQQGRSH